MWKNKKVEPYNICFGIESKKRKQSDTDNGNDKKREKNENIEQVEKKIDIPERMCIDGAEHVLSLEQLLLLWKRQNIYIDHLESELKQSKEQIRVLKQKIVKFHLQKFMTMIGVYQMNMMI